MQLMTLAQLGGVPTEEGVTPCTTPAVVVNQAGGTKRSGVNWLLPVAAKDSYQTFVTTTLNAQSYEVGQPSSLPVRQRL